MPNLDVATLALFQSTLPGWGATLCRIWTWPLWRYFNPRSPDGERRFVYRAVAVTDFNPRSPDGERLSRSVISPLVDPISIHAPRMGSDTTPLRGRTGRQNFNPRSPDGERLIALFDMRDFVHISIHAPRMGSDLIVTWSIRPDTYFNPRSPDGERLPRCESC